MEFYELQNNQPMSQLQKRVCRKYHPGGERMKPKKLVISAFGPYGEKTVVDFEKLGEKRALSDHR